MSRSQHRRCRPSSTPPPVELLRAAQELFDGRPGRAYEILERFVSERARARGAGPSAARRRLLRPGAPRAGVCRGMALPRPRGTRGRAALDARRSPPIAATSRPVSSSSTPAARTLHLSRTCSPAEQACSKPAQRSSVRARSGARERPARGAQVPPAPRFAVSAAVPAGFGPDLALCRLPRGESVDRRQARGKAHNREGDSMRPSALATLAVSVCLWPAVAAGISEPRPRRGPRHDHLAARGLAAGGVRPGRLVRVVHRSPRRSRAAALSFGWHARRNAGAGHRLWAARGGRLRPALRHGGAGVLLGELRRWRESAVGERRHLVRHTGPCSLSGRMTSRRS